MSGDVVVHIGLHKTGSTSLQGFLAKNRQGLLSKGAAFYEGLFIPDNHVELHHVSMRPERDTPFRLNSRVVLSNSLRVQIEDRVSNFCRKHSSCISIFSNEGVSYVYHADEIDRLKQLFSRRRVRIVAYLRRKSDFLAAYRAEIKKHTLPAVIGRDSFAYTEGDSWLIDYDDRIRRFRDAFDVEVFDYDREVERCGSIIPSFLGVLGVESAFSRKDWETFRYNRRPSALGEERS